jgi:hypothetical protein
LLKKCCKKIADAYKYQQDMDVRLSIVDSLMTATLTDKQPLASTMGDQSFASPTAPCSLGARYGMPSGKGGRFSLEGDDEELLVTVDQERVA